MADELNFGRAADLLHIAQPALSRSIAALERELGVRLFERSRAGTRMTPAGELLHDEARSLLHAAEVLQRRVRRVNREGQCVTVGFMPGLILTPLVRHLEETFPGLRVDVVRTSWTEQIAGVRDGRFDACIAHRPFTGAGLRVVGLFAEPRLAAMSVDHRHAGVDEILLADLAGDVLLQPADAVPEWRGKVSFPGQRDGGVPSVSPTVEEKFELVAAGRGIVVIPESATRYYRRPDLHFARVVDLPRTEVCIVTESDRRSPVLQELVTSALALGDAGRAVPDADAASVETEEVLDAGGRAGEGWR